MKSLPPMVFLGYRLIGQSDTPAMACGSPRVRVICSMGCLTGPPEGAVLNWDGFNHAGCHNTIAAALATLPGPAFGPVDVHAFRLLPLLFRGQYEPAPLNFPRLLGCEVAELPSGPESGFVPLGFDAVSVTPYIPATAQYAPCLASFSHSPLSCNALAADYPVNQYCLFNEIADAMTAAARFAKEEPEPGPYVVVEVLRGPPCAT